LPTIGVTKERSSTRALTVEVDLIGPAGGAEDSKDIAVDLSAQELVTLYRQLVFGRRFDRECINLAKQGHLAVYASSAGQEAVQVGAVSALRDQDWLFPTYRDSVATVSRGVDPVEVLALFRGTRHSGFDSRAHRVAPLCTPIASQTLHAAGLAMASRLLSEDVVALALIGDGGTSEGEFHEALGFAAVFDAPAVFVVQNNQWAISVPIAKQTRAVTLAHKAVAHGMKAMRVDGNDILAVHMAIKLAVAGAHAGAGPTLVEAITYRIEPHTTSDDPRRYRTPDEELSWRSRDPVSRLEKTLTDSGTLDDQTKQTINDEADEFALDMRQRLIDLQNPEPHEIFDFVYSTSTRLNDQRAALLADLGDR